jgi:hypothetical protein
MRCASGEALAANLDTGLVPLTVTTAPENPRAVKSISPAAGDGTSSFGWRLC